MKLRRTRLFVRALEERAVPAIFTVTNTADSGAGSLRQAVTDSNNKAGSDSIVFDVAKFATPQTITLTTALPNILDSLTISAKDLANVTVSGNNSVRVFNLATVSGLKVTMENLTIANGKAVASNGGGILAGSIQLSLVDCTVTNCQSDRNGGGISFDPPGGQLTLTRCTVSNNKVTAGGAFEGDGGGINLENSTTVTINSTTISGNLGFDDGGGIYFKTGGSLTLDNSTISGNAANGPAGDGGGIFFTGAPTSIGFLFRNSTISGNTSTAFGGGMLFVNYAGATTVRLQNCTVTGNGCTTGAGGGFYLPTTVGSTTVALEGTIVSGNVNGKAPDLGCKIATSQKSAIGSKTGIFTFTDLGGTLTGAALNLGPLAKYGGPTMTHALQAGSAALNSGMNSAGSLFDQRGTGFVRSYGTTDIGAYEFVPPGEPTAAAIVPNVTAGGTTTAKFDVQFFDDVAIDVATLGDSDVRVTGPSGYNELGKFVSVDNNTNGTPRIATYEIPAPGGTWDGTDNGDYTVSLEPNQVFDTSPTAVAAGALTTFKAVIPITVEVTNANDSGPGSLRQAVIDTNMSGAADFITFNVPNPSTINLLSTIQITDAVTVTGPGSDKLTITGGGLIRPLRIDGTGVFAVSISGATITSGKATDGAGLYIQDESITLTDMVFTGNQASATGGAVRTGGTLNANQCRFVNNQVTDPTGDGGALFGATGAHVSLMQCTVANNTAADEGGALSMSTIQNTLSIDSSTFSNNSATSGGALSLNLSDASLLSSTFSGNKATKDGGAIQLTVNFGGTLEIELCTIVGNSAKLQGGGIVAFNGTIDISASVVSGNSALFGADISNQNTTFLDRSAVGDPRGFVHYIETVDLPYGIDLRLGPLADNGGLTLTHMPLAGSPLRETGTSDFAVFYDQRGAGYLRPLGTEFDIGAIESTDTSGTPIAIATTLQDVKAASVMPYQFEVTYTDDVAIKGLTLGSDDVRVVGPNGFDVAADFVSVDKAGDGSPRVVTYQIMPPGGAWDSSDVGSYSVMIQAGAVTDTVDLPVLAGSAGAFRVILGRNFTVTNTNDSGPGSLRQAMIDANANAPAIDTITFDATVFATMQTITLTTGELTVNDSVTVNGPGASLLQINGNNASRIFNIFVGGSQGTINITGMTLNNAATTASGGAILNYNEFLSLTGVTITNCTASASSGGGGAIAHQSTSGSLALDNCILTGNKATGSFGDGGAILLQGSIPITISNSVITNNSATDDGGAINNALGGTLIIANCNFNNNTAGGDGGAVLWATGTLSLTNSTFANNKSSATGGAMVFTVSSSGSFLIEGTTFSGNQALGGAGGGLLFNGSGPAGKMFIRSSTFSGNASSSTGAGMATSSSGTLTVQNCTFTGNAAGGSGGGGIGRTSSTTMALESTIVSGNSGGTAPDLFSAGTMTAKNCAIGSKAGVTTFTDQGGNLPFGSNLMLGGLANNGGPTQTHALLAGSPCINAGSNPNASKVDQRGVNREWPSGKPDIGAYEVQPPPIVAKIDINNGEVQRSRVSSIKVTFDQHVTLPASPQTAFELKRQSDGLIPTLVASVDDTGSGSVIMLSFTGSVAVDSGSLADGLYKLTVLASKVSTPDGLLDGDINGTGGDDYVLTGTPANGLFRLFGDSNGDAVVNSNDFTVFRTFFGLGASIFDFNNDGQTNSDDFTEFRKRFGLMLP